MRERASPGTLISLRRWNVRHLRHLGCPLCRRASLGHALARSSSLRSVWHLEGRLFIRVDTRIGGLETVIEFFHRPNPCFSIGHRVKMLPWAVGESWRRSQSYSHMQRRRSQVSWARRKLDIRLTVCHSGHVRKVPLQSPHAPVAPSC